jgi:iron complex outermembrane receptor protein
MNESTNIGTGYVLRSAARQYINDGTYNLADPYGASEEVRNAMTVTTSRLGKFNQEEFFANVQFDILETDAGMITTFVGAEYRTEDYADQYDSLSEAGQVGGSSGSSATGNRSAKAVFFEALVPVIEDLEINIAGRYDDYSDYGSDFSPKFSVRYSGIEDLVLRASWGEGFRAPSLPDLNQKPAESADSVTDDESCIAIGQEPGCSLQINALVIANPNLESENSESIAAGLVWNATDFLDLEVDYYNIEVTNRIRAFSSQSIIDAERAGDPMPPAFTVSRAPNGAITQVVRGFGNDGILETSGLDLKLATNFDLGNFGSIRNNVSVSYIHDYSTDGGRNFTNDPGVPEYRATIANVYQISDFDFAWNINIIGDQCEDIVDGECEGHIPTWVTNDLQAGYNAPWNGKFTIGAQNIGGKQPPLFASGGRDYNFDLYNGYGRVVYFNYKQTF